MTAAADRLPYVDEHAVEVRAGAERTWGALLRTAEKSFSSSLVPSFARLVGCADHEHGGPRPLAEGSTLPGFHVAAAAPRRELALAGEHRFSDYALVFRLDEEGEGRTRLRAETRAAFPGLKGSAYRTLVIGTRMHALITRRLLGAAKARAERP